MAQTLLGGLQGSKSCTCGLKVIFPEVGDLEDRLAPATPAVLVGILVGVSKGNQVVEAFLLARADLFPLGR